MTLQPKLLGLALCLALTPAPGRAADAPPSGAYAVLKVAPTPPRAGCRVTTGPGGELRAPLYAAEAVTCPIARVGSEEIVLGELGDALAGAHVVKGGEAGRSQKAKAIDFTGPLDRIIDVRLVVMEAREMGLQELPDYKQALDGFRASTLRTTLQKQAAAGARPDPAGVEKAFRAAVKEWKVRSVMFEQEADAKAFREAVTKGGAFEPLAKAAVADKKARGGEPGFVGKKVMVPELARAADALKNGQVSQPIKIADGWVVFRLEDVRYPEDATAREAARAQSLAEQQHLAIRRYHEALTKKWAKVDTKLLASLDFEAGGEAGFKVLAADQRPLVQIRDDRPITVADLAAEIGGKFFHGMAEPIKEHRVSPYKQDAFEILLGARLFAREARERKLAEAPDFRLKVEGYDRVLAFTTFIERVLLPEVKVTEPEVQALYEQRKATFTTPEMLRLDGLAFGSAKAAQAVLEKLRGGTDLEWLRSNAEGLLRHEAEQLRFAGALLSAGTLPATLVKALSGAQPNEYRLYASDDGAQHYVLRVVERVPAGIKAYVDVREPLGREIEAEKVGAAVRDYAAKLRKVQKVDVLISRIAV
jgi:parvulin-like peptidyl-prolyl isomerase